MFGTGEEHPYIRCSACGAYQIRDVPVDMSKYYPQSYYSFSEGVFDVFKHPIKRFLRRRRDGYAFSGRGLLGRLMFRLHPSECTASLSRIKKNKATRILDVGCGKGLLLYGLKELGLENLLGIDPFNAADIRYANGLEIRKRDIFSVQESYDIIMFHHVLEHMANPGAALAHAKKILAVGGTLIVRVPVVPNEAFDRYGEDWVDFDCPRHLFNFSIPSLGILARAAGLSIVDSYFDSTILQFWGSEQYRRGIPYYADNSYLMNPTASVFSRAEIRAFGKETKRLNRLSRGDQAVFYLKPAP
jgi:SAM-dependent methyltransferase